MMYGPLVYTHVDYKAYFKLYLHNRTQKTGGGGEFVNVISDVAPWLALQITI